MTVQISVHIEEINANYLRLVDDQSLTRAEAEAWLLKGSRLVTAAPVGSVVWILDLEAQWDDDYVGWQSVHAERAGAFARLTERLAEHGLPWPAEDAWLSRANADDGSFFGDFAAAGAEVHIGVHRMPVE
jgi:hypothetical protein